MAVYIAGDYRILPGMEREFLEAWRGFAEKDVAGSGGGMARLLRDKDETDHFLSFAEYADERTVTAWRGSDEFQQAIHPLKHLVEFMETHTFAVAAGAGRSRAGML